MTLAMLPGAMAANRRPASVSTNSFDPAHALLEPEIDPRALPLDVFDLAVDAPMVRKVATIAVRPDDKEVFDAVQAWWHFRHKERLTQWELFTAVLAGALTNEKGRFVGARDVVL